MTGGAKIRMNYYKLYSDFKGGASEYDDMEIKRAIKLAEGDDLNGFVPVDVFKYLVTPQLEKLKEPALELLQETYDTLEQIAFDIIKKIFLSSMVDGIMDIVT